MGEEPQGDFFLAIGNPEFGAGGNGICNHMEKLPFELWFCRIGGQATPIEIQKGVSQYARIKVAAASHGYRLRVCRAIFLDEFKAEVEIDNVLQRKGLLGFDDQISEGGQGLGEDGILEIAFRLPGFHDGDAFLQRACPQEAFQYGDGFGGCGGAQFGLLHSREAFDQRLLNECVEADVSWVGGAV